jgi:hypothetical protein
LKPLSVGDRIKSRVDSIGYGQDLHHVKRPQLTDIPRRDGPRENPILRPTINACHLLTLL